MTLNHIFFPCANIQIEGELQLPEGNMPLPAVIICHPHPLFGGDMNNNVVMAICSELLKKYIAVLRFNFRGVGNSGGRYGDGIGEKDDVRAALDYLSTLDAIDSSRIGLAGYSFGGMVSASVAIEEARIKQLALVSPALHENGWKQIRDYTKPKIILVGDTDTVVPFGPFQRFLGDKKQYRIIAGADHSWWGFEEELGDTIARFFSDGFKIIA